MTSRLTMLVEANDLLLRTECFRDSIAMQHPKRLASAEAALRDTRRVCWLVAHSRLNTRDRIEIASLLKRANTLIEAIGNPLQ